MTYKYITKCNIQKYVHFFPFTLITFLVSMLPRGFEGDGSAIGLSYLAADMKNVCEGWGRNGATHRERNYYNYYISLPNRRKLTLN